MDPERYDYTRIPLNGREFEEYVGQLFADLGYEVEVTQASRDFGADVILTEPGSGRRVAVQAKFYGSMLGPAPVQEVACSLAHYGAAEGWVVTNSTFTPAARRLADENRVRLVEGSELRELVEAAQANRASAQDAGDAGATGVRAWRDLDFRGLDALDGDACVPCEEPGDEPAGPWGAAAETSVLGADAPGACATSVLGETPGATWAGTSGGAAKTSVLGAGRTRVLDAGGRRETLPLPRVGAPTTPAYASGAVGRASADEPRYTLSELAGLWGVSPNRIRRMVAEEGMPLRKMPSGRWEVGASELAAWTREHDERVGRQAARDERRERSRRAGRVAGTVVAWALVAALAVAAVVVVHALVEEVAPGSTDALLATLEGLAAGLLPGAGR